MRTIHKYRLEHRDQQELTLPVPGEVLSCGVQNGDLTLWAVVGNDTREPDWKPSHVLVTIRIYGTGHPLMAEPGRFLNTVFDGPFVWHVYVEGSRAV